MKKKKLVVVIKQRTEINTGKICILTARYSRSVDSILRYPHSQVHTHCNCPGQVATSLDAPNQHYLLSRKLSIRLHSIYNNAR